MASRMEGLDGTLARLTRVAPIAKEALGEAIHTGLEDIQQTAAALVAVDTGQGRETLLDPSAIKVDKVALRGEFGLITAELQERAWYLKFIEWGTKGYVAGSKRIAGSSRGRLKFRTVKRNVPARPARPFMRPALDLNRERLKELHRMALDSAVRIAWKTSFGGVVGRFMK